jgi:hypothetical protein
MLRLIKTKLLLICLVIITDIHSQTNILPTWFSDAFRSNGLDKKYIIASYLKPAYLKADFNSDGIVDIAALITEKGTNKKGIVVIHGKTNQYFVFGGGTSFNAGGNDFKWADKWSLYRKNTASETQFDKEKGDIIGGKTVKLKRPSILVEDYEDGAALAGGIIYWDGTKYIWIHQGE